MADVRWLDRWYLYWNQIEVACVSFYCINICRVNTRPQIFWGPGKCYCIKTTTTTTTKKKKKKKKKKFGPYSLLRRCLIMVCVVQSDTFRSEWTHLKKTTTKQQKKKTTTQFCKGRQSLQTGSCLPNIGNISYLRGWGLEMVEGVWLFTK